jgi:sec-independent protein translocase protein TatA
MFAFLEGNELLVVLLIVLVLFGGSKLPQLARSLGQAQREFARGRRDDDEPKPAPSTGAASATAAPTDPAPHTPAKSDGEPISFS